MFTNKRKQLRIERLANEWNKLSGAKKAELMTFLGEEHIDLYWSIAWLAAHENVEREIAIRLK